MSKRPDFKRRGTASGRPPARESDYRSRSPDRSQRSPRFQRRASDYRDDYTHHRDRDRDADSYRSYSPPPRRSFSSMSTPVKPEQGSDRASAARPSYQVGSKGDPGTIGFTNLICEKAYWCQRKRNAEKKLKKLREDRERSGSRHTEYATVVTMFQSDIKNAEKDLSDCNQSIDTLDQMLGTEYGRVTAAQCVPAQATQTDDANHQIAVKTTIDEEIQKLKTHFESELNMIKTQYEQRLESETYALKKELSEMSQKHKGLEKKQDQLERKHDGGLAAMNLRFSSLDKVKRNPSTDGSAKTSESPKPPNRALPEQLVEDQNAKIAAIQSQLDSALQDVKSFQKRFSNKLSNLEEVPEKLATVQALSKQMSALEGLSDQVPAITQLLRNSTKIALLEEMPGRLSALEKLTGKLSGIEEKIGKMQSMAAPLATFSDHLPVIEQLLSKSTMHEELSKTTPLLEELSNKLPGLEQLLSKSTMYEEILKTTPLLEELSNKLPDVEQALENFATLRKESDKVPAQLEELSSIYRDAEELVSKLPAIQQAPDRDPDLEDLTKYLPTLKTLASDAPKFDEMSKDISKLQQWQTEMESSGSSRERVDAPLSMGEAEVRKIVMPLFQTMDKNLTANFQKRLHGVAENLGGFLTEERKGLEDMDKRLKEVDGKVQDLDTRAAMMDQKLDDKFDNLDASLVSTERTVDGIKKDADKLEKQVTHLEAGLANTKAEYFGALHTLQFQILHLDNWASNFTTKQMYSEIVEHISAILPGSVTERVRVLSDRVDSLEDRVDDSGAKRRKMVNGSAMAVNE